MMIDYSQLKDYGLIRWTTPDGEWTTADIDAVLHVYENSLKQKGDYESLLEDYLLLENQHEGLYNYHQRLCDDYDELLRENADLDAECDDLYYQLMVAQYGSGECCQNCAHCNTVNGEYVCGMPRQTAQDYNTYNIVVDRNFHCSDWL